MREINETREMKVYVERLFSNKEKTKEIQELKEEVISNMQAKYEDLLLQGISSKIALEQVKKDIDISFVEDITDTRQEIAINIFYTKCVQQLLLAFIFIWIFSIPTMIYYGWSLATFALFGVICCGIVYIAIHFLDKKKQKEVNRKQVRKLRRYGWLIWGMIVFVKMGMITMVQFGSNIWFHHPIIIDGPYALGEILLRYYIVLITIFIPISLSLFPKILKQMQEERAEF